VTFSTITRATTSVPSPPIIPEHPISEYTFPKFLWHIVPFLVPWLTLILLLSELAVMPSRLIRLCMRFCIGHECHVEYFTALCYIKVLRQKVPELADQEKNGVMVSAGSISAGALLRSPVCLQWSCGSTSVRSFRLAQSDIKLGAQLDVPLAS
jgi:hypothetical protein